MIFSCDFETTTTAPAKVWAWGMSEVGNENNCFFGENIDDFFITCKESGNHTCYFFNLKFDGSFIIHRLLSLGYEWRKNRKDCENRTFTTIISDDGKFYAIEIYFMKEGKKTKKLKLLDAAKLFPGFSVARVAKSFKLPIMKGSIDYARHNTPCAVTPEEWDYLKNDCQIVAMALAEMFKQSLNKMTIGSCCLSIYKKQREKDFKDLFPVLPLEIDAEIRRSYKGGYSYANPQHTGEEIGTGVTLDVNSLYPSVMRNRPMPYGMPLKFNGKYANNVLYPLFIQNIRCSFSLKPNKLPTIQIKAAFSRFCPTEYLSDSGEELVDLCLCSPDLELFLTHYELKNASYNGGYMFRASTTLFCDFIDYWTAIKIQADNDGNEGLRTIAKLMLNNLYGKFALNPHVASKQPFLKDDILHFSLLPPETRDPIYIPVGTFCTSWARYKTITTSQKIHEESILKTGISRYLYSDTDSIHMTGTDIPDYVEVHKNKLGYWKHESTFYKAKFLRAKRYIEYMVFLDEDAERLVEKHGFCSVKMGMFDGSKAVFQEDNTALPPKITCAGMPDSCYKFVTWENFTQGSKFVGKLRPQNVPGGIILVPTEFTMNL